MFALMYLAIAATMIGIAIWVGLAVYRGTQRRWVQIVVTIVVLWLPFWDVAPGLYLYHKAIREMGGVRIYRTVHARGYLNSACGSCFTAWTLLGGSSYDYIEVKIEAPDPLPGALTPVSGYYAFRLFKKDSLECTATELPADVTRQGPINDYGIVDMCVTATRSDEPISRYEYSFGQEQLPGWALFRPVKTSWMWVRDRSTNKTIAESYQIHFVSWLARRIMIPQWHYSRIDEHTYIEVNVRNVIRPQ